MRSDSVHSAVPVTAAVRRLWATPDYSTLRAGDAELFANPDKTDEGFTKS